MTNSRAVRTGGRAPLGREVIVATAIELAATGASITFRSLGTALGADPTAVYRHFRDKEELTRAVVDQLMVTGQSAVDHAAPWRDQLRDGAVVLMDTFAAHPWAGAEVTSIVTGGPGELEAINWILEQLERAGLKKSQSVRYYAAYSSYVLSAAASLSRQRLRGESATAAPWVGDLRAVDAVRLPALFAVIPELVKLSDREVFVTGIEIYLDSVEASARDAAALSE